MHYRLMNDYTVQWPFWADGGAREDGDPVLPAPLADAVRAWAALFNAKFDFMRGWPNVAVARQHEAEGQRLYEEASRALPDDSITLHYWETLCHGDS